MKTKLRLSLLLLISALGLAACNKEGVAAFSAGNDRVAVITKVGNTNLYTTDIGGGSAVKIEDTVSIGLDVSFDPFGGKVLYAGSGGVCISNAAGGGRTCPLAMPSGVASGFLSFLPNGDFIFVYKSGSTWEMRVYRPDGSLVASESGVDQFFLTTDAYKVKRDTNGTEWFLTPYNKPPGQQNLRWVITRGTQALMYNAAGSLEGPTPLARQINTAVQDVLRDRDQLDITSGAVSPDGTKMVFRTKTGSDPNFSYSLYALDLATNSGSFVPLVSNANFRVQFAFSPNGGELVYESNSGGRSVWIANANGSNPRKLADNASLPEWR